MVRLSSCLFSILLLGAYPTLQAASSVNPEVNKSASISIQGVIIDEETKEPLFGATVQVVGSSTGSVADFDGQFQLKGMAYGQYEIEIKYLGYETVKQKIDVNAHSSKLIAIALRSDAHALEGVQVVAKINRESEYSQMIAQQKATLAVQGVGAKELSRKGIGDAQGAVAQISGVAKQAGVKNVFVRGLGDRYNQTTLNGFEIPSDDPEHKNISLDLFSSDMLQSVGVNKAFSASSSGDVAGAQIDIVSKELVGDRMLNISASTGVNTQTIGAKMRMPSGVGYWGTTQASKPDGINQYSFKNQLDPHKVVVPVDHSFGLAWGNKWNIRENNLLTVYAVASQDKSYSQTIETIRNTTTTGTVFQDQEGKKDQVITQQLLMTHVGLNMPLGFSVDYNALAVHSTKAFYGDFQGVHDMYQSSPSYEGVTQRQQLNENRLYINQLSADWDVMKQMKLSAGASYSLLQGKEPDRRINNFVKREEDYTLMKGTGVQQRFFSDLDQRDLNMKFAMRFDLKEDDRSNVTIGYRGRLTDHAFQAHEYEMSAIKQVSYSPDNLYLDQYYNQENFQDGWFEMDLNSDEYRVDKQIHAAYAEATYQVGHLTANAGVSLEDVYMRVDYDVNRGGTKGAQELDKFYLLPSVNLKYDLSKQQVLRLGASKSYTLPQAKEIAPYRYIGLNFASQGNENLQPSDNYQVDLKWDWYIASGEMITLGAFYKYIQNPIARIELASAGGFLSYENIADHAQVAGLELEIRKTLFSSKREDAEMGHRWTVGGNLSYLYSHAQVEQATDPSGTALEGASPFLANVDMTYQLDTKRVRWSNTVLMHYFSDRIYTIGTQGYQDIIEKGIPRLDFVTKAQINDHFILSVKCENLLNQAHILSRKGNGQSQEVILSKYQDGIKFNIGVNYQF